MERPPIETIQEMNSRMKKNKNFQKKPRIIGKCAVCNKPLFCNIEYFKIKNNNKKLCYKCYFIVTHQIGKENPI